MTDCTIYKDMADIADLMDGWVYRDTARWDQLRALFHPDGTLGIGWFEGLFSDFVDASIRMQAASKIHSRHTMASPLLTLRGHRAVAETSAVLTGVNPGMKLGFTAYTRFYDLVEKRDGAWKIARRDNVFDMAFFSFPAGPVPISAKVEQYPWEYAALAYVVEASGHPVATTKPTRGSAAEAALRAAGERWLAG